MNHVVIDGVSNLLTTIAGCCKPVPGDSIMGYVSVGRGITVHRSDCRELKRMRQADPDRLVEVSWSSIEDKFYPVEIFIRAYDRQGLLRDVSGVLANNHVNVTAVNTHSDRSDNTATMTITVEISGLSALGNLLGKINQLPTVVEVKRHHPAAEVK